MGKTPKNGNDSDLLPFFRLAAVLCPIPYAPDDVGASGRLGRKEKNTPRIKRTCAFASENQFVEGQKRTHMADTKTPKSTAKTTKSTAAKKSAPRKTAATARKAEKVEAEVIDTSSEAKSRFNAALEEAKAGAAALRSEAEERAGAYRDQAKTKGDDLMNEARAYGDKAVTRAGELASDGKNAVSDGMASLGKVVADTAEQIDERFGEQYGDYARKASRSLAENSAKLEAKSVDEIGEDAREFVRKSPGVAVGIAAVAGFLLARMLRGPRD